jgi:hypothetical protein
MNASEAKRASDKHNGGRFKEEFNTILSLIAAGTDEGKYFVRSKISDKWLIDQLIGYGYTVAIHTRSNPPAPDIYNISWG